MSTLKHYFTAKGLDVTNINSCPPLRPPNTLKPQSPSKALGVWKVLSVWSRMFVQNKLERNVCWKKWMKVC